MSFSVEQDIFRLQVSNDDPVSMPIQSVRVALAKGMLTNLPNPVLHPQHRTLFDGVPISHRSPFASPDPLQGRNP